MIRIVTDSTSDLPAEWYADYPITVVPINIQFGTETYLDGVTIDKRTFYDKIEQSGVLPKTSQPSVGQFQEQYARLADAGADEILSVHVTAKLSGTFQSAELAKELVADQVQVHTFDSACGSAGLGYMAVEAARMAGAGHTVAEILARLEQVRPHVRIALTVRDLKFAQMSGRVGRLQGSLASLLNVKPIVLLENGVIDVSEKVRSRRKALARLIEILSDAVGKAPVKLAVVHAEVPDEARDLLEQARRSFNCVESFVSDLALSLAVQFGPGTLGLVVYPA